MAKRKILELELDRAGDPPAGTVSSSMNSTKALMKYERSKMKRDARQKCSLFLRKSIIFSAIGIKFILVVFSLCTTQLAQISHRTIFFQVPKSVLTGDLLYTERYKSSVMLWASSSTSQGLS